LQNEEKRREETTIKPMHNQREAHFDVKKWFNNIHQFHSLINSHQEQRIFYRTKRREEMTIKSAMQNKEKPPQFDIEKCFTMQEEKRRNLETRKKTTSKDD